MSYAIPKDVEPEGSHGGGPGNGDTSAENEAAGLEECLSESETEFVAAERKPINRSALVLFTIMALGGAGTYVMYLRSGPQAARASTDPAVVGAQAAVSEFMKGGSGNISLLHHLLDSTAKVVEQFRNYPNVAQIPLSELHANPFHFATAKLPAAEDPVEIARRKKEEERIAVLKSLQTLQLQTIVLRGSRKACMINNVMYQEGETVDAFTLEKITQNAVIVRSSSFRFELKMTK